MKTGELTKHLKKDIKEEKETIVRSRTGIKRDKTLLKHSKKKNCR